MSEEYFLCLKDHEESISVSAGCRCCCETVTAYFDAGEVYTFDVGRYDGEIISASYDWQFNTFDVPANVLKEKFRAAEYSDFTGAEARKLGLFDE